MVEDRAKQAEAERLRVKGASAKPRNGWAFVLSWNILDDENSLHVASKDRIKNLAYANFWSSGFFRWRWVIDLNCPPTLHHDG